MSFSESCFSGLVASRFPQCDFNSAPFNGSKRNSGNANKSGERAFICVEDGCPMRVWVVADIERGVLFLLSAGRPKIREPVKLKMEENREDEEMKIKEDVRTKLLCFQYHTHCSLFSV